MGEQNKERKEFLFQPAQAGEDTGAGLFVPHQAKYTDDGVELSTGDRLMAWAEKEINDAHEYGKTEKQLNLLLLQCVALSKSYTDAGRIFSLIDNIFNFVRLLPINSPQRIHAEQQLQLARSYMESRRGNFVDAARAEVAATLGPLVYIPPDDQDAARH